MNWFQKLMCKLFHVGCEQPPVPPPTTPCRTGLLFGYYGLQPGDAAQIADHVNYAHIGAWGDWTDRTAMLDSIVALGLEAQRAGIKQLVFTLDFCLFAQTNPRQLLPEATAVLYLQQFFSRLIAEDLWRSVYAWYVIDEPNITQIGLSAAQIESACVLVRVAGNHTHPLWCIYGQSNGTYPAIQSFDVAGMDNYGAPIFTDGEYDHLRAQCGNSMSTMIVPGGGSPWKEDPWPYYNKAQQDTKIRTIIAFKWFGSDGIGVNGMAPVYRAVGLKVKEMNP